MIRKRNERDIEPGRQPDGDNLVARLAKPIVVPDFVPVSECKQDSRATRQDCVQFDLHAVFVAIVQQQNRL